MRKASITEAKNNLSALIESLNGGGPVVIVERGRPVARLEPVIAGFKKGHEGRLSRLLRDGIVRPRRAAPLRSLFKDPPPRAETGASALDALIEERREGR